MYQRVLFMLVLSVLTPFDAPDIVHVFHVSADALCVKLTISFHRNWWVLVQWERTRNVERFGYRKRIGSLNFGIILSSLGDRIFTRRGVRDYKHVRRIRDVTRKQFHGRSGFRIQNLYRIQTVVFEFGTEADLCRSLKDLFWSCGSYTYSLRTLRIFGR